MYIIENEIIERNEGNEFTGMKVRIADRANVPEVSKVLALSWKSEMSGIVYDEYLTTIREDRWIEPLMNGLDEGLSFISILESDEGIQGVAVLRHLDEEGTVNLVAFYLLPERIGKGYGSIFFDLLEIELHSRGYKKCVLDVLEGNNRAIRFYEKKGFVVTGKTEMVPLGDVDYLCIEYGKELKSIFD